LPTLVPRQRLVEANSKLQASGAVVEVSSFGIAGAMVQLLTAPVTILVDALSFVVSALSLALIRTPEPPPRAAAERQPTWVEIRDGLRFVLGQPVLRALGAAKATRDVFLFTWVSMLLLLLSRELRLEPGLMGALFAIGGLSSLLGALWAGRVVRRWGLGSTLVLGMFMSSASLLFVPLAGGPMLLVLAMVGAQQLFDGPATVYEINETSLIQAITPDRLLGRVAASLRGLEWSAMLAGALLGGLLGETIGPRATMLVGALGTLPAALWLVFSPIRSLRQAPIRG
jgi:predicted MFS family arabinose efflux permease